jgi:hypothetical protein
LGGEAAESSYQDADDTHDKTDEAGNAKPKPPSQQLKIEKINWAGLERLLQQELAIKPAHMAETRSDGELCCALTAQAFR